MSHRSTAIRRAAVEGLEPRTLLSSGRLIDNIGRWDNVNDMVIQPDGKIVIVGYTDSPVSTGFNGPGGRSFLARYLPDGSPDVSFGKGGKAVSPFVDGQNSGHLALGPDGSIFVGGSAGPDGVVTRYRPDGSLDTAYGNGGRAIFDVLNNSSDTLEGIAVLPDGSVLAAAAVSKFHPVAPGSDVGSGEDHFALLRFTPDGKPDASFGHRGQVLTTFLRPRSEVVNGREVFYVEPTPGVPPTRQTSTSALAVAPDGKIIVGGTVGSSMGFARYNPDGTPDTTFGENGQLRTPEANPGAYAVVRQIVPLPDGRMLTIGGSNVFRNDSPTPTAVGVIARFNADGSPDSSYGGGDGLLTGEGVGSRYPGAGTAVYGFTRAAGDIDYVGISSPMSRYSLETGERDESFGDGQVDFSFTTADANDRDRVSLVRLAPDGKIVLAGVVGDAGTLPGDQDIALARLNADGSADTTFGQENPQRTDNPPVVIPGVNAPLPTLEAARATLQPNHTLVINGTGDNDAITILSGNEGVLVTFAGVGQSAFPAKDVRRIKVSAGGGNDAVAIGDTLTVGAWVDGGAGNDRLTGGGGRDRLIGGAGEDVLNGRAGRDLLVGGADRDTAYLPEAKDRLRAIEVRSSIGYVG